MTTSDIIYPHAATPANVPSYVSDSVRAKIDEAMARSLVLSAADMRLMLSSAKDAEAHDLRAHLDGNARTAYAKDHWAQWGHRTLIAGLTHAVALAAFREGLAHPMRSHVSTRENVYGVYQRDPGSPTNCRLIASASCDLPGVDVVLAGVAVYPGGLRGVHA